MDSTNLIKNLSDGMDIIAKKLGVAVDKIYPILFKQAQYRMALDVFWIVIGIILLITTIILFFKFKKSLTDENGYYNNDYDTYGGIATIPTIIGLILMFIASVLIITFHITEMLQIIINPDWYILNNIIKPLITSGN